MLIANGTRVEVKETSIDASFTTGDITNTISTPAKLVRRGNELRLALPPDHTMPNDGIVDFTLIKLVAQGFAAREHLIAGQYAKATAHPETDLGDPVISGSRGAVAGLKSRIPSNL